MSPLRRLATTSRWALLALVLSAPIALVPYALHSPGVGGAIGLPGLKEFAGAVRAALPQAAPVAHRPVTAPRPSAPAAASKPVAHRTVSARVVAPSGRHLQSVVTASCAGCAVVKDRASGALRATVSSSSGRHAGSAYAVVDMGIQHATLAVQDRLALGAGQVPAHSVDVLQVTDAENRVVYGSSSPPARGSSRSSARRARSPRRGSPQAPAGACRTTVTPSSTSASSRGRTAS